MSAIVAAHGPFDEQLGRRMLDRMRHRGPDGSGTRRVGQAWLGSHYLAIIDPDAGEQPIGSSRPGSWLIGDGEIYNHQRIRDRLGADRFSTDSDLEAALELFEDEGVAAFERLWGTFALVVAAEDGRFAAARDVLGISPLYWARRGETVVFASELKAFDEDWRALVEPFPPGHAWTPQDGLIAGPALPGASPVLLKSRAPSEQPPAWVFAALRETLVRAVERSLPSRSSVGILLSGGVDSSIITAIAARIAREQGRVLPTFAVGMAGSGDLAAARLVAEHVGTDHHELVYTAEDAIALVPRIIAELESFDPTLVHSAVPHHLVASLAARHVTVVLAGEGADELFAGYSHYGRHDTGEALHEDLLATLEGMHIGGLQRVDRVAGAHGIEPRLPFLDLDFVELALALPPGWKLLEEGRPAKWLLRQAFDSWLPAEVLWRRKEQFGEGTGMNTVLSEHYEQTVTGAELDRAAAELSHLDPPLRTREELAYYRLFTEALPGIDAQRTVGRFAEA
ncbi:MULTISPECIES: asparagine synthase (glutamine-hydrolyzing) [unclassified Pseudactinotalea]|uniref:asparagine synthase (glutamine-hydrolyzing) n=1 Tax=unclassified Pseudactinotalea TaxID=2649176 RepID=UPI00128AF4A8|nr:MULTISPECIES: asparagine synthase (glutamine-hydrolyzing) [unclassified Pseudactinotalea]MPV49249.1 asparagine synthase (glutamine-hydrolyzing) [Pseudactinotalea sp. HY160]QGH69453.1 asparagine synthase (glutamine-hydrolyzing) [Pseudactinotalea sp. HY158]